MNTTAIPFQHRHAAHCESGAAANLMTHHGAKLSEAMAFGLSSALSFTTANCSPIPRGSALPNAMMPSASVRFAIKGLHQKMC